MDGSNGAKSAGIIYPPPDLRAIVDKTAQYVAKTGPEFEQKVLSNEKTIARFQFLMPDNPYHAYYKKRVEDFSQEGEQQADEEGQQQQEEKQEQQETPAPAVVTEKKEGVIAKAPQVMAVGVREKPTEDPAPYVYSVKIPVDISPLELDIIKLTAQYVARNGRQFLSALAGRESRSSQFEFLKLNHRYFEFFTQLADVYKQVLIPPPEMIDRLSKDVEKKLNILNRSYAKAEWDAAEEEKRRMQEQAEDEERNAYNMIDWHDFVVVETIEFKDDEHLPQPQAHEEEMEIDDMEVDEEVTNVQAQPVPEPELSMDEAEIAGKIRRDYTRQPKAAAAAAGIPGAEKPGQMVRDPITGELIPLKDLTQHLRIELLDPRWKEQQEKEAKKLKNTNVAAPDEITRSIAEFARRRTDIFGDEEVAIGKSVGEENRPAKPDAAIWDGYSSTINQTISNAMATMSTEQQMAAFAAQNAQESDKAVIGPNLPEGAASTSTVPTIPGSSMLPTPPGTAIPVPRPAGPGLLPMPGGPMIPPHIPAPMGMQAAGSPTAGAQPAYPGAHFMPPQFPGAAGVSPVNMPPMVPPPPTMLGTRPASSPMEEEPSAKKMRTEEAGGMFVAEETWLKDHPDPVRIKLQVPLVEDKKEEWKLDGAERSLQVPLTLTVNQLKDRIRDELGIPANKQRLNIPGVGFLKDQPTLAYYNVADDTAIVLGIKERGGKK